MWNKAHQITVRGVNGPCEGKQADNLLEACKENVLGSTFTSQKQEHMKTSQSGSNIERAFDSGLLKVMIIGSFYEF